jgi:release factor glutamine methyltransferase
MAAHVDAGADQTGEAGFLAFDVLGVGVAIRLGRPELADPVRDALPPGARERDARRGDAEFAIDDEAAIDRLRVEVLEHVVTRLQPPPPGPAQPPAIQFVRLVLEIEGELVQLSKTLEAAKVHAVLRNGDEVRPAVAHGGAFAFAAALEVPRAEVPRTLGVMEAAGWRRLPGADDARYIRGGMIVRVRPGHRPDPNTIAKGRFGFLEPTAHVGDGKPQGSPAPAPLDPGGPLRTGIGGAVLQAGAEALTVLDTLRLRTKERDFHGVSVQYGPGVFEFQPLTEPHVELVLSRLPPAGEDVRFVEVGTGTGAVALSVARARPDAQVLATDVSLRALGWARRNRRRLGLRNVRLAQGSLLAPVPRAWRGHVTTIAANLPLGPPRAAIELHVTGGWPIGTATGPGADGLGLMRALARDARDVLAPGGYVHLQLQDMQSEWIAAHFEELGYQTEEPREGHIFELTARWPGVPAAD